jgi:hypothetical protein
MKTTPWLGAGPSRGPVFRNVPRTLPTIGGPWLSLQTGHLYCSAGKTMIAFESARPFTAAGINRIGEGR